jgi:uncharacterized paraquat-inducible protein A
MKKETEFSQNKDSNNLRKCPECGMETIMGMPGGKDATCKNCGYKDPCCYD